MREKCSPRRFHRRQSQARRRSFPADNYFHIVSNASVRFGRMRCVKRDAKLFEMHSATISGPQIAGALSADRFKFHIIVVRLKLIFVYLNRPIKLSSRPFKVNFSFHNRENGQHLTFCSADINFYNEKRAQRHGVRAKAGAEREMDRF